MFSFFKLIEAHFTNLFNLSRYSISYIDLPAFDSKGSNSENWDIFSALTPNLYNYTQNLYRFNYTGSTTNQSVTIDKAFAPGNWSIQAYQTNYIINCSFNNTLSYLGDPTFYKDDMIRFNFTLLETTMGNYRYFITPLNLITIEDLKAPFEDWGLIYLHKNKVILIKESKYFKNDQLYDKTTLVQMVKSVKLDWKDKDKIKVVK